MRYKNYLFDFDGMLTDSYEHIPASLVRALKESRGVNLDINEVRDAFKISKNYAFKKYNLSDEEATLFRVYEHDPDFKPLITPFMESLPLLKAIKEAGGNNYIYTDRLIPLEVYLDRFGFRPYIDGMKTHANKPDPKPLDELCEQYNLVKSECVVIGDRAVDVDSAYDAGIDGILYDVDSSVYKHHATYVINKINEIYKIIDIPYRMRNNYHTHTIRCNHAVGSDEEYVLEAIKTGYATLGMSDHIHYENHNINDEYIQAISLLKEKYKTNVTIKIGFECEYYDDQIDYLRSLKENHKVDYLTFGNHWFIPGDGKDLSKREWFLKSFSDPSYLDIYYNQLEKAINSGLFKYICHPDCYLKGYGKWDDKAIKLAHKIARIIKDNNCYCELSGSGVRQTEKIVYNGVTYPCYPFIEFYKIMKEHGVKCVLGCDAHSPAQLHDFAVAKICEVAKEANLDIAYEIEDL